MEIINQNFNFDFIKNNYCSCFSIKEFVAEAFRIFISNNEIDKYPNKIKFIKLLLKPYEKSKAKIDLNFIKFYVNTLHNKSIEDYFHVNRTTVSNWKNRGMPIRYLKTFIDLEKSDNIQELFERIYPK